MKSTVAEDQLPKKNGLLTRAEELKIGTKLFDQVVLTLGWWRTRWSSPDLGDDTNCHATFFVLSSIPF